MIEFLNKPYPFNDDLRHNAKIILFISIGVLAFLLLFQPIEIYSLSIKEIFQLLIGIAGSTFLVLSLNLIVLPSLFPKIFYSNVWNVKREIIWNIWILLTISGSDFLLYTQLFGMISIHFTHVLKLILLGILPVVVLVMINQDRLLRSHLRSAQLLNKRLIDSKEKKEKLIHFESEYKKDSFSIPSSALILIKSADNYIEVFYKIGDEVKKQMIRYSLKKAMETLEEFEFIIRCHRTFIININSVKEITGNSQGYKLFLDQIDFPVFVSQKYIMSFKEKI
jgi:hypothetical protein